MIIFRLNTHSGVPPYLQIVHQVKQAVSTGLLKEGDKLPSVKEAVTMTAVNPNTVFKAYRELEGMGLVEGQAGIGTFVLKPPAELSPVMQAALGEELGRWIVGAQKAGLDDESIEALFHITLRNTNNKEEYGSTVTN